MSRRESVDKEFASFLDRLGVGALVDDFVRAGFKTVRDLAGLGVNDLSRIASEATPAEQDHTMAISTNHGINDATSFLEKVTRELRLVAASQRVNSDDEDDSEPDMEMDPVLDEELSALTRTHTQTHTPHGRVKVSPSFASSLPCGDDDDDNNTYRPPAASGAASNSPADVNCASPSRDVSHRTSVKASPASFSPSAAAKYVAIGGREYGGNHNSNGGATAKGGTKGRNVENVDFEMLAQQLPAGAMSAAAAKPLSPPGIPHQEAQQEFSAVYRALPSSVLRRVAAEEGRTGLGHWRGDRRLTHGVSFRMPSLGSVVKPRSKRSEGDDDGERQLQHDDDEAWAERDGKGLQGLMGRWLRALGGGARGGGKKGGSKGDVKSPLSISSPPSSTSSASPPVPPPSSPLKSAYTRMATAAATHTQDGPRDVVALGVLVLSVIALIVLLHYCALPSISYVAQHLPTTWNAVLHIFHTQTKAGPVVAYTQQMMRVVSSYVGASASARAAASSAAGSRA